MTTLPAADTATATLQPTAPLPTLSPSPTLPSATSTLTPMAPTHPVPTAASTPDTPTALPAPTDPPSPPVATANYVFPIQPQTVAWYPVCHHDYPASDIFAPIGSRFVAVTAGVIDFVSYEDVWNPQTDEPTVRSGLSVAIIGADGVRYYGSHLSQIAAGIAPGVVVRAGQLLGLTGKSGNARNTDPHLHFGISHPTTADDWAVRRGEINPYPYLNAWRDGIERVPNLQRIGGGAC